MLPDCSRLQHAADTLRLRAHAVDDAVDDALIHAMPEERREPVISGFDDRGVIEFVHEVLVVNQRVEAAQRRGYSAPGIPVFTTYM